MQTIVKAGALLVFFLRPVNVILLDKSRIEIFFGFLVFYQGIPSILQESDFLPRMYLYLTSFSTYPRRASDEALSSGGCGF